jgi:hypothetical protein
MEFDFSDVKPSLLNWLVVGLMAITFISLAKFLVNTYPNKLTTPFKDIINSV